MKVKRKGPPRTGAKGIPRQKECSEVIKEPHVDSLTKRKTWDTDTEMVDCEGDQKRSCFGDGNFVLSDEK